MASQTTLGPILSLAMTAFGIVGMVAQSRARRARRNGTAPKPEEDINAERHRAAKAETDRRMAAYLASRPRATDQED